MSLKNLVGMRFGRLVVTKFVGYREHQHSVRRSLWECVCDCGKAHITTAKMLRSGSPSSCGCLQRDAASKTAKTHGMSRTKIYKVWTSMRLRCSNPNDQGWHRYGARGITVCKEWDESFDKFYKDMGDAPDGHSVDRIDNDGPYSKDNCRWATKSEQGDNTRVTRRITHLGKTQSLRQWCKELNIHYTTALERIKKYNLTTDEIFSATPFNRGDLQSRRRPSGNKS